MIAVTDVAHVRFRAPDLDQMEAFLTDFGLVRSARTGTALYMRGTDTAHHLHVTELGEPAFLGVALAAASRADLEAIARAPGASGVERIDEPGGGHRVRLTDPNGIAVEVVHGIEALAPLPVPAPHRLNTGTSRDRRGERQHCERGPARVKRLGHFVLLVEDFRKTEAFYHSHFGFRNSDEIYLGERSTVLAAFMRLDRGAEYVDHHAFLAVGAGRVELNHVSFEVQDLRRSDGGPRASAQPRASAPLGCRTPRPRLPDLRLLARSVRQRARAHDRRRSVQRGERDRRDADRRPGRRVALGAARSDSVRRVMPQRGAFDADVLVVGAGPVGMVASLLLAQQGLTSLVVERRAGVQRAPAAHVVNARSFEILRAAGADMQAIARRLQGPCRCRRASSG